MLGMQTDCGLASQVEEQHVAAINAAALKTQQDCRWVNAQGRVTIDLQDEQNTINYPENAGPGSIQAMAIFESDRYYPVEPRIIPVHADQDQQQIAGGDTFAAVQGRPRYFEQRQQIILWPYTDKPYKLRIDYNRPVTMPTPNSVSIVDGQLIIYAAASMISAQMADVDQSRYYIGLYTDRRNALMAWQSEGTNFAMSSEADLAEDEFFNQDLIPRWDRRPTIAPGA
jgi:hypothetical protein